MSLLPRRRAALVVAAAGLLTAIAAPTVVSAHPIDQYVLSTYVTVAEDGVRLELQLSAWCYPRVAPVLQAGASLGRSHVSI